MGHWAIEEILWCFSGLSSTSTHWYLQSYSHDSVIFETGARHSYAEAVGKNIANPTAVLLTACNMLRHLNLDYHATIIRDALHRVIKAQKIRTKDLGGHAKSTDFTRAVIQNVKF